MAETWAGKVSIQNYFREYLAQRQPKRRVEERKITAALEQPFFFRYCVALIRGQVIGLTTHANPKQDVPLEIELPGLGQYKSNS